MQFLVQGLVEQLHRLLAEVLFSMLLPVAVKFSRELLTLCAASLARCFSCCFISSCYCFCHWPKVPWLPCGRLGVDFFCCSMMCVVHVEKVVGMWGWRWRSFLPCPYTKTDCRRMSESNESQNLGSVFLDAFSWLHVFPWDVKLASIQGQHYSGCAREFVISDFFCCKSEKRCAE